MSFQLSYPAKIIFGSGTFSQLGALAGELGRRALVIIGRSALRKSGRLQQALDLLGAVNVDCVLFENVHNDPMIHLCDSAIQAVREQNCDLVISIGGGSVLDVGKIAATIAPHDFSLSEFFQGKRKLEKRSLPFIAVPTTAGSGSECTRVAVLTDEVSGVKKGVRHEFMMPRVALVDPELTLPLPPDVTAHTGMDALTQAIECYVGNEANPISDSLALSAIELLSRHLPPAVADGSLIEHREKVSLGSLMTGMAFGNTALGAVHGLAHPIGALLKAPHGLVCALLLPNVCEFNVPSRSEKFSHIASIIGAKTAEDVPGAIRALNQEVGLTSTLGAHGLKSSQFPQIIAQCRSGSMANNPRTPTDTEVAEILRKSL